MGSTHAAHLQTHTIPQLATEALPDGEAPKRGLLSAFRRKKTAERPSSGCDPSVFADQVLIFLQSAAEKKRELAATAALPPSAATTPRAIARPQTAAVEAEAGDSSSWSSPFEWRPAASTAAPAEEVSTSELPNTVGEPAADGYTDRSVSAVAQHDLANVPLAVDGPGEATLASIPLAAALPAEAADSMSVEPGSENDVPDAAAWRSSAIDSFPIHESTSLGASNGPMADRPYEDVSTAAVTYTDAPTAGHTYVEDAPIAAPYTAEPPVAYVNDLVTAAPTDSGVSTTDGYGTESEPEARLGTIEESAAALSPNVLATRAASDPISIDARPADVVVVGREESIDLALADTDAGRPEPSARPEAAAPQSARGGKPASRTKPVRSRDARWLRSEAARAEQPAVTGGDDLRALLAGLSMPTAVASVRYPSGCRIRRVRVIPLEDVPAEAAAGPVILSKRALDEARRLRPYAEADLPRPGLRAELPPRMPRLT